MKDKRISKRALRRGIGVDAAQEQRELKGELGAIKNQVEILESIDPPKAKQYGSDVGGRAYPGIRTGNVIGEWQPPPVDDNNDKMKAPTLADAILRRTYDPDWQKYIDDKGVVRGLMLQAKRFVLTTEMSAFMADLAYASVVSHKQSPERVCQILDGMRAHARLPHKVMWIEYDHQAKVRRAHDEYGAHLNPNICPDRSGWLLMQHPTLDTAFKAVEFSSHAWDQNHKRISTPQPTIFGMAWRTDDGPPPWPTLDLAQDGGSLAGVMVGDELIEDVTPEGWLTGIPSYKSSCVTTVAAFAKDLYTKKFIEKSEFNILNEMSGDLRYLWSLLTTINQLPVTVAEVRQSKGFIARGSYRRFMDHQTVHLSVPTTRYRTVARHAIAIARRKRHPVRGHWRKNWVFPATAGCEHIWQEYEGHVECTLCHGRRMWIPEHERGDASLGFVTHDYRVAVGDRT